MLGIRNVVWVLCLLLAFVPPALSLYTPPGTPQALNTTDSPTFAGVKLSDSDNTHKITIKSATDEAANYDLLVPDLAGNDTLCTLSTTQTIDGVKTFSNSVSISGSLTAVGTFFNLGSGVIRIYDADNSNQYIFTNGTNNLAADRNVKLPLLTADSTFAFADFAQTFSGVQTFASSPVLSTAALTANGDTITIQDLGNANIIQSEGAQTINGTKTFGSEVVMECGAGAETVKPSGRVYALTTSVSTAADTTETDGATKSVGGNTLNDNGDALRFTVWGTTANNANNKTIKLYYNGVAVFTSGTTSQNKDFHFEMLVMRTSAGNQKIVVTGVYNDTAISPVTTTATADETAGVVVKNTMTNGTASAADITTEGALLEVLN